MLGFPGGSAVKKILLPVPANEGDAVSVPGSGRSPGEGSSNPLQDSCLGNLMEGGAWQAAGQGMAKSQIRLSNNITCWVTWGWLLQSLRWRDWDKTSGMIENLDIILQAPGNMAGFRVTKG